MSLQKPDTAAALHSLKDFQRRTVDHVFARLYGGGGQRRFLVADEVGLGKTLVAKGVIARVIDQLWDKDKPIEIIYICSNQDIARQNIRRLKLDGCGEEVMRATRLSLLPLERRMRGAERVNFIALTPGTSFELTSGGGQARERAVLYLLLQKAWAFGQRAAPWNVLAEHGTKRFESELRNLSIGQLDPDITARFIERLKTLPELRTEFEELCALYPRCDSRPSDEDAKKRPRWLGKMRTHITRACIESLQPSLIIIDEFQRFRDLLDEKTDAGRLAADLFGYADASSADGPRTLLLSATPYKMLAMHHETGEDHYSNLLATLSFLDGAGSRPRWQALFRDYQQTVLRLTPDTPLEFLSEQRDALVNQLNRVMVRTERLAASPQRGGMLVEKNLQTDGLAKEDVRTWLTLQGIADVLKQGDCMDYWKSAPYVLNFMDDYAVKRAFTESREDPDHRLALYKLVSQRAESFLPINAIESYKPVPALNARLRALERETLDAGAWKLLWMPPAMPHYALGGVFAEPALQGFTKSLVFSAWHVVPKAVSTLLSYEAERRMMRAEKPKRRLTNTAEVRKKRKPLLRFNYGEGKPRGLPLLTLVYPCLVLADIADPLKIARSLGTPLPSLQEVLAAATARIAAAISPLLKGAREDGPEDETWYWLTPMLLDQQHHTPVATEWWQHATLAKEWMLAPDSEDEAVHHNAWDKHVAEARSLSLAAAPKLGRPPADLAELLACMAVAAPATCALRTLGGASNRSVLAVRLAAGRIGHAFLSMFNVPEVRALLLSLNRAEPYWRRVLDYAASGGFQAVLDEFVHLLREDRRTSETELSHEVCTTLRLRASSLRADHITSSPGSRRVKVQSGIAMRVRFAMRFGDDKAETEETGNRKETVRQAFNSPFWPFVLVTTSVGQEGLDFHRYCHRVVHWNLPSNPVDLEQREGRVHRYKGHAVRKNISQHHREEALGSDEPDLWQKAFSAGAATRRADESELIPYWSYSGSAQIERCVPALPLSREVTHLHNLRRALTIYRMAFGHVRQEDVIEHLLARVPTEQHHDLCKAMHIDLSPPDTRGQQP